MPNAFAYVMLLAWPLVSALLFRRLPLAQAVIWTILGGYMALPPIATIGLPLLPDLDKVTIPNLCAYVGFMAKKEVPWAWPRFMLFRLTLALFVLTPIGTVLTNGDFIALAGGGLPSMAVQEIPSSILSNIIIALPLLLAFQVFQSEKSVRDLIVALVLAGLIYSIPMLIEIRLSPQLNVWIYGFFQHSFDQMMRYGGFRPIVFMPHGLWVAFFSFMCAFAAVTTVAVEDEKRWRHLLIATYLGVVLLLCKSANALIYVILFTPTLLFLSSRLQVRIGAIVAAIVLFYPMLRGAGFIPTEAVADFAGSFDAERAGSLVYRLVNEDTLLAHAQERPLFGWGGWARNLVHDPISGRLLTIVDGHWIVTIGMFGWFGYLGEFGLLTLPLLLLGLQRRHKLRQISKYASALALILTANLIDLVPNATLIPFTWLLAGAVLGYAEFRKSPSAFSEPVSSAVKSPAPWAKARIDA